MDYLQYVKTTETVETPKRKGFKPYYKWITFNTHAIQA